MKTKMEQFPATNPNPVVSVGKDGTVLYSNVAGEPLLREWSVVVGEKLPSFIGEFVRRVIFRNSPEKMEVKVGNKVYLITFHPSPEDKCANIYGFDISDQKEIEEKLRIREKQTDILYKIGKNSLECESLQIFMDESLKLIASILEQEYCKIMELMPDGNFLLRAEIGWKPEFVGKHVVGGEKGSQAGYTLLSRMPVIVDNFAEENRFEKPEILKIHGVVSGASIIIGSMGKIYGVLVVNSTKKRKFTTDDTYFLNSVAFLIAQVVESKKAEEALKEARDRLEEKVKERTTQLEKAYNSLKESENSLSEAQRMAHIGNVDWNLVTGEIHFSDEMYRIFGLAPKESNVIYDELLNHAHSDDRDYVDNAFQRGLKGEPFGIDYRIILANGEERTVHTQIEVIFDEKNTPVRMRGTLQDITERKKAEEKIQSLANIVESSNDAIGTLSLEGIITSWNKGAEQVYGYSAEEVLGKNISILAPSHLGEETKKLSEGIKKGENIHQYETIRLKKDGKRIDISITLSPVFDTHGKLTAISFISRDITTIKEAEEKFIQEKQIAEVANRAKSEFLTNMSHELRTPLNSIIGFSDLLYEQAYGELNEKQLRSVGNISKSGKHLLNLINDILDISKVEAGKLELDYKDFDLAAKFNIIRNLLSPIASRKNIKIEIEVDNKLKSIRADEKRFVQIMYNLVDNAIKFSYEKGLVKIEARNKGNLVEITVKDTGIGIEAEDQNKLFKPFSQIDPFSSKRSQGTGLGLSLVKQIVHLHGGYIWFRSNPGKESTFAFTIPLTNNKENSGYIEFNQNV